VLGLTLACAQCHDHKFDPISQKDYFQVFAYFNTLGDAGLDGNAGNNSGPSTQKRTVLKTDEEARLRARVASLRHTLTTRDDAILAAWVTEQRTWLADRAKGTVRIPLDRAMELAVAKLSAQGEPRPAGAIDPNVPHASAVKPGGLAAPQPTPPPFNAAASAVPAAPAVPAPAATNAPAQP
jgi:hypothetical protein